jgi:peptidoglycan hydrolase-like protein with peptidoglycan-binding domain
MGFESFFLKKEPNEETAIAGDADELKEEGLSRRTFLRGGAAVIGASMLPGEAFALDSESIKDIEFRVAEHVEFLKKMRSVFAEPGSTKQDKLDILSYAPPTTVESLQGTVHDHRQFFASKFPTVQVRYENKEGVIRFAYEENVTSIESDGNGSAFFVDYRGETYFLSNKHVAGDNPNCIGIADDADIVGCPVEKLGLDEAGSLGAEFSKLEWNESILEEDVFGELVHIPVVNERDGERFIEFISGFWVDVEEHFFGTDDLPYNPFFSKDFRQAAIQNQLMLIAEKRQVTQEDVARIEALVDGIIAKLKRSTKMLIIPPFDLEGDGTAGVGDLLGISGSPVLRDVDCQNGRRIVSGIAYAAGDLDDEKNKKSYSVAYVHGPEVIAEMLSVLRGEQPAVSEPEDADLEGMDKEVVTRKIQEAVNAWRRSKGIEEITVDGLYGERTKRAVHALQVDAFGKRNGGSLYTPGIVDRVTWKILFPGEPYVDIVELHAKQQ